MSQFAGLRRLLVRRLLMADGSARGPVVVLVQDGKVISVEPFVSETAATTYVATAQVHADGTIG